MGARVALNGLQPGTLYYLQFQAKNEAMGFYSQWSNIFELQTIYDIVPPMPVENLTWESIGTSFTAKWDAPTYSEDGTLALDLAGYEVTIWAPADGAVPGIPAPDPNIKLVYKTISPNFDFSFEMNKAGFQWPRGKLTIEVRAFDVTGNMSQPTIAVAQNPVPAQVTGFDAIGGVDQISFKWNKNPDPPDADIMYYRIRQGNTAATVNLTIGEVNDIQTSWTTINTALQYFSIVAVDVFYQESAVKSTDSAQARSSLEVDTTNPGVPTSVTTTSGIDTGNPDNNRTYIDVTWVKPSDTDLQEYIIRYSSGTSNWQYMVVPAEDSTGAPVQTARIQNLIAGTPYYVAIQSVDFTANHSAWVNSNNYPQSTPKDTTAPSTPAAPTVVSNTMQMQVSHNLKRADGTTNLETDISFLEVYASASTGFTPASTNKLGDMNVVQPGVTGTPVTAIETFNYPSTGGNVYVKVIAVDFAGNKSPASAQATAVPGLISAANIADATITNAKISDLSVSKVTAGTGTAFDWTINSTLTLGSAGTNGVIVSYDYVNGGTTGFRMDKSSLVINNGNIAARAIRLQDASENIMHPAYADFEWAPSWYTTKLGNGNGSTLSIDATTGKYGFQSLRLDSATTANAVAYLAPTNASYNVDVEGSTTYIVSCFVQNTTGSPKDMSLAIRENDADTFKAVVSSQTIPNGTGWTRVYGTVTTNAATTKLLVYVVNISLSTTLRYDGFQVEKQMTGAVTPSQWTPPSYTAIDGGQIRTGSIQSTAAADGVAGQPAWSINTQGNAQLGDVSVRGTMYVGPVSVNEAASSVRSGVYAQFAGGSGAGWIIRGDGYAEFNNVLVRGNIQATSGRFLNTIIVGANSTDSSSSVASTNYVLNSTGWTVRGDGYAEFNNVRVVGNVYANGGYFRGDLTGASGTFSGNLSAATINGGTITGANVQTRGSVPLVQLNSTTYNKILFWAGQSAWGNGENAPADIRVAESAADRYIQMYSADYGGGRALISVGAGIPNVAYPDISIIADRTGGNIYMLGDVRIQDAVGIGDNPAGYYGMWGWGGSADDVGLLITSSGLHELRVKQRDLSSATFRQIRASGFPGPTSSVKSKNLLGANKNRLEAVRMAPTYKFHYKADPVGDEFVRPIHHGVVLEDLPDDLIHKNGNPEDDTIETYMMIAALWEALRELDIELDDIREYVHNKKNADAGKRTAYKPIKRKLHDRV
jgi:hypothetical protein